MRITYDEASDILAVYLIDDPDVAQYDHSEDVEGELASIHRDGLEGSQPNRPPDDPIRPRIHRPQRRRVWDRTEDRG